MTRTVSIHQPAYLPWLGYFDKIRQSDLFIYLDTVQFQKNSFQNRNKIRTSEGWIWLTVPVETKGRLYSTEIKDLTINNRANWRRKHLESIRTNYRKATHFDDVFGWIAPYYEKPWDRLSDLCFEMMIDCTMRLGLETKIVRASEQFSVEGAKSDLVLELCKAAGATRYLSGSLGRDYLDLGSFADAGIEVDFQNYQHPQYPQAYPGFESGMGVVDLFMCADNPSRVIGANDD